MDDKSRFYIVKLGKWYVSGTEYLPIRPPSKRNELGVALTQSALYAKTFYDEAAAVREADKTGGEVCCFGIYDAKTVSDDPVEALFSPVGSTSGHGFDWALQQMKSGNRVHREDWNGRELPERVATEGVWIAISSPHPKVDSMDLPFIYMRTITGSKIPWAPTQTALLHHDWLAVD